MSELITKAKSAKTSAWALSQKTTNQKNTALHLIAEQLMNETTFILEENDKDLKCAKANNIPEALIDRLILNEQKIHDMSQALKQLAALSDPTGNVLEEWQRPNGLSIKKVSVPIGVVGMIYEARPNVTLDASSLCLKTGNAVLLRGSSSALHSNMAIVNVIHRALERSELPINAVQLLEDTGRDTATQMFKMNAYLDVLIPRGGKKLIQTVVEQASVPVLETGEGNCHIFVDETANQQMAINITVNAKTQRPSVCNATETVIVHENWAKKHLTALVNHMKNCHVELRGDEKAQEITGGLETANEEDWGTEYLDNILAVKIVSNVHEAMTHINRYGSKHSEAIITESEESVQQFFHSIDASAIYHNASTRFTDGFEFGLGAEIGISTQKLHARGPMGLAALTSTTSIIRGDGQIKT